MTRTQKETIKRFIVTQRRTLSSMEAFEYFKITRLAAIIFCLRQEGYDIVSIRREDRDSEGKLLSWWTDYRLAT